MNGPDIIKRLKGSENIFSEGFVVGIGGVLGTYEFIIIMVYLF